MPMDKSKYPHNWKIIADLVKFHSGNRCQVCGRHHGEDGTQATTLTVHHIDHDPMNCKPENLIALCASCHLKVEGRYKRNDPTQKCFNDEFATLAYICPQCYRTAMAVVAKKFITSEEPFDYNAILCGTCHYHSDVTFNGSDGIHYFPVYKRLTIKE